jgi:hypothetical protein
MSWWNRKRQTPRKESQPIAEAFSLLQQFEKFGRQDILDEAIDRLYEGASMLEPNSPFARAVRSELAFALDRRGVVFGQPADVESAVGLLRDILRESPSEDPDHSTYQGNLATFLRHRYELKKHRADLDEALALDEGLLQSPGLDGALLRNNLAKDLNLRFLESSNLGDLDRSIALQHEALASISDSHPQRYGYMNNLANALVTRYRVRRDFADIREAVEVFESAWQLTPQESPDRAGITYSLAQALSERAKADVSDDDSERSVRLFFDVLEMVTPDTHLYQNSVANIANAFVERYPITGDVELLNKAIELTDYMLSVRAATGMDPTAIWTRADAFRLRYDVSASPTDMESANESARAACELSIERSPMNTLNSAWAWAAWAGAHYDWAVSAEAWGWCLQAVRKLFSGQSLRRDKEAWLATAPGLASEAAYGIAKAGRPPDAVVAVEQSRALLLMEALSRRQVDISRLRDAGYPELADRYVAALAALDRASMVV